jgi:DNA-binding PadR family transcriptional regulator
VNSGQLYQTISRLEQDGLIRRVDGGQGGREDRHVFAITGEGVQEFERWFDTGAGSVRLSRRPLLVKITLAGPDRLDQALEQLDVYERDCTLQLQALAGRRDMIAVDDTRVRADHVLLRLNLSADMFQLEGELRWTAQARDTVRWLRANQVVWPSAQERAEAVSDAERQRQDVRRELYARMSVRHLSPLADQQLDGGDSTDSAHGSRS